MSNREHDGFFGGEPHGKTIGRLLDENVTECPAATTKTIASPAPMMTVRSGGYHR